MKLLIQNPVRLRCNEADGATEVLRRFCVFHKRDAEDANYVLISPQKVTLPEDSMREFLGVLDWGLTTEIRLLYAGYAMTFELET